jgi:hypothetical protein
VKTIAMLIVFSIFGWMIDLNVAHAQWWPPERGWHEWHRWHDRDRDDGRWHRWHYWHRWHHHHDWDED